MNSLFMHTFVLSQVFGLYLLLMAIIFACRAKYYRKMIKDINPNGSGVFLAGAAGLLVGLFLVTIHNSWGGVVLDIVTLFFWLILILSVLLLSFPERMVTHVQKIYSGHGYHAMVLICAVLGIILMASGYYLYM